ncbi:hypothetical protein QTP70_018576, partial [Hemibagrus guttatus]
YVGYKAVDTLDTHTLTHSTDYSETPTSPQHRSLDWKRKLEYLEETPKHRQEQMGECKDLSKFDEGPNCDG